MGRELIGKSLESFDSFTQGKDREVFLPEGWTYLIHGTNKKYWGEKTPFNSDSFTVHGLGLSVVEKDDAQRSENQGMASTSKTYQDRQSGGHPFEIRILFYKDCTRSINLTDMMSKLDDNTINDIKKYYYRNHQGGRHPLVPNKTNLVKVYQNKEDGVDIFYYIPEQYKEAYQRDVRREKVKEADKREKPKEVNNRNEESGLRFG